MQGNYSKFEHLPSSGPKMSTFDVYKELTQVAEEIERCRALMR